MTTAFHHETGAKPKFALSASACLRPGVLQRKCACGGIPGPDGKCPECREKRLQRKTATSQPASQANGIAPPIVHEVLRSPGQPLDPATRAFMEPRFGHDFSRVRIHTGARAAKSAGAVDALAYTVGRDIVFGAGHYSPATNDGKRLLAHELAHTVQQSRSMSHSATDSPSGESVIRAGSIARHGTVQFVDPEPAPPELPNAYSIPPKNCNQLGYQTIDNPAAIQPSASW